MANVTPSSSIPLTSRATTWVCAGVRGRLPVVDVGFGVCPCVGFAVSAGGVSAG
jgi:hypothetical protein